jgi:hypothetical protein
MADATRCNELDDESLFIVSGHVAVNADMDLRLSEAVLGHSSKMVAIFLTVCKRLEADLAEILPTGNGRLIAVDRHSIETCHCLKRRTLVK